jgi:hypothetical protein
LLHFRLIASCRDGGSYEKGGCSFPKLLAVIGGTTMAVLLTACAGRDTPDSGSDAGAGDGGWSGAPDSGLGPIAMEDFPARFAEALCSNIGPCCQQEAHPHDVTTCYARAEAPIRSEVMRVQTEGRPYDAAAARSCVDTMTFLARSCYYDGASTLFEDACEPVFRGNLPEGAPCTFAEECTSGGGCGSPDGGPNTCQRTIGPKRANAGDSCVTTCMRSATSGGIDCTVPGPDAPTPGDQCYVEDGLFCESSTYLCTPTPLLGQACMGSPCRGEAYCESGACVPKRTSGPCSDWGETCASTAYCDRETWQCQPRKALGETCSGSVQCASSDRCSMTCRRVTVASPSACMGKL